MDANVTTLDTGSFKRAIWQPAAKDVPAQACLVTQNLLGNRSTEIIENLWKVLAARMFTVVFFLIGKN